MKLINSDIWNDLGSSKDGSVGGCPVAASIRLADIASFDTFSIFITPITLMKLKSIAERKFGGNRPHL
ncbi:unnamed protein product [Phytophthora fragariaefolia]|uniref:Unnamed protein product n=1 Tax=Phytophthora fragariaefolia TaxID=1490495 RepID=A0A9W6XI06_9STRA|nr:unnamed protein product [Phytophthora fragariaefolia]